ncbi:MAG: hypothetical protein A3J97_12490 [Spirochaetes bacterium RIFOXYC1_FULL_54_7]|nr:MAG: hypothetical protein A3J97_12490 [Spirochaetes bacterium RIFOXYC1_FULL_54_7]
MAVGIVAAYAYVACVDIPQAAACDFAQVLYGGYRGGRYGVVPARAVGRQVQGYGQGQVCQEAGYAGYLCVVIVLARYDQGGGFQVDAKVYGYADERQGLLKFPS